MFVARSVKNLIANPAQIRLKSKHSVNQLPASLPTMSKSRMPLYLGLTAAGGVGYYLYNSGGKPKVAEKQFESRYSLPPNIQIWVA